MRPLSLAAGAALVAIAVAGCSRDPGVESAKPEDASLEGAAVEDAEHEDGRLEVGKVLEVSIETPHPYPPGEEEAPVWQERIEHPGASFLKLHFVEVDLAAGEAGEDFVVLRDGEGMERYRFAASDVKPTGELWALAVEGDQVVVELYAPVGGGQGFRIDRYGHGDGPG